MNKYYDSPGGIPGEFNLTRDGRRGRYNRQVPVASTGIAGNNGGTANNNTGSSAGNSAGNTGTRRPRSGCGDDAAGRYGLTDLPVAMTYAPVQNFNGLYEPAQALARGTMFSALDLPLLAVGNGTGGKRRG